MIPGVTASQITQITIVKIVSPSIQLTSTGENYLSKITNNDTATVTIYADVGFPVTSYGEVTAGNFVVGPGVPSGLTLYAQAKAAGKEDSDVVSAYAA
jgi:hypothetical protein